MTAAGVASVKGPILLLLAGVREEISIHRVLRTATREEMSERHIAIATLEQRQRMPVPDGQSWVGVRHRFVETFA